jgi:ABC-type dipeptide transport system, periplasmic component
MMKFKFKKFGAFALAAAILTLTACSNSNNAPEASGTAPASQAASGSKKVVNVGVTYSPNALNPLAPVGQVSSYVNGLLFLPLVELDEDLTFKPMLADSIETADNRTFTVKINPNANWTDGTPVTADDVIFSLKLITNEKIASPFAYMFAIIEGIDDFGYLPEGAEISGLKKVDDKTVDIKLKAPTTLNIFQDTVGRYLLTVPQAALKDVAPADINKSDFMQKPTLTNGPFKLVSYDRDHYVQMEANKDYFKGAPKLDQLNFKVLQGTAISAQLQSGEIDMNIPSFGVIPIADYEKIQGLESLTTNDGPPIATQFMYINSKSVPDAKQRQAISYAMNRELIVDKLLKGSAEAVDGFLTSFSPYKDPNLATAGYDPEKAKSLLQESGWNSGKTLNLAVLSGDATLEQAANIVAENLKAVGVNVTIQMMDLATIIDKLVAMDYDLGILTVSLSPVNPLPDIAYYLQEGNPTGFKNEEASKLIAALQSETDESKLKESYIQLQRIVAQEVPMPSIYATKALGAVNDRVTGAKPKDFGMFINVNEWDVK